MCFYLSCEFLRILEGMHKNDGDTIKGLFAVLFALFSHRAVVVYFADYIACKFTQKSTFAFLFSYFAFTGSLELSPFVM